jgi:hypothetical protein
MALLALSALSALSALVGLKWRILQNGIHSRLPE